MKRAIGFLPQSNVRVVGLSAHDSDDWAVQQFSDAFGAGYRPMPVGEATGL